jgi:hypothetical protein
MGQEIKMSLIAPSELSSTLDPRPHTTHASPNAERYLRLGRWSLSDEIIRISTSPVIQ